MRRTLAPSAEIEGQIDQVAGRRGPGEPRESRGMSGQGSAPGCCIQRAVEVEFDAWPGRARYERRPDVFGAGGRNNDTWACETRYGPRRVQTADGALEVKTPAGLRGGRAVRDCARSALGEATAVAAAGGDAGWRLRSRAVDARTSRRCAAEAGVGKLSTSCASRISAGLRSSLGRAVRAAATVDGVSWWRSSST